VTPDCAAGRTVTRDESPCGGPARGTAIHHFPPLVERRSLLHSAAMKARGDQDSTGQASASRIAMRPGRVRPTGSGAARRSSLHRRRPGYSSWRDHSGGHGGALDEDLASHGYQLWTATVGTVIEAQNRGVDEAIVVVHQFRQRDPAAPFPPEDKRTWQPVACRRACRAAHLDRDHEELFGRLEGILDAVDQPRLVLRPPVLPTAALAIGLRCSH
jgi:hypothetical protein